MVGRSGDGGRNATAPCCAPADPGSPLGPARPCRRGEESRAERGLRSRAGLEANDLFSKEGRRFGHDDPGDAGPPTARCLDRSQRSRRGPRLAERCSRGPARPLVRPYPDPPRRRRRWPSPIRRVPPPRRCRPGRHRHAARRWTAPLAGPPAGGRPPSRPTPESTAPSRRRRGSNPMLAASSVARLRISSLRRRPGVRGACSEKIAERM